MTTTSSQAVSPVPVPFYGDTLFLVEKDGVPMTPLRPIIENIGLQWRGQWEKVTADAKRWGGVGIYIPSSGGPQEMLCIPVRKLPAFLFSISPNKVPENRREKLIKYQEECDDALWNYWTNGKAVNPRAEIHASDRDEMKSIEAQLLAELRSVKMVQLDELRVVLERAKLLERLLNSASPLHHDIYRYRLMGLRNAEIAKLVDKTEKFVADAIRSRCRYAHLQPWAAGLARNGFPTLNEDQGSRP